MTTVTVVVSDYKFACFIAFLLAEHGIVPSGAGINLTTGHRDMTFEDVEIPETAHYIPKPIQVNLPPIPGLPGVEG